MNILRNMDALFIEPSCEYITGCINEFWKLSGELQADLGEKGHYLDQYLSTAMEAIARSDIVTVGEMVNGVCWSILGDCYILCEAEEQEEKSEFFDMVKEYIDAHPVNFKHKHTRSKFYAANILINNLEVLSDKIQRNYRENTLFEIDYQVINNMYEKISDIIGEKRMEKFNQIMYSAFMFAPIVMAAVQQIVIWGLQMLNYRDPESSKRIYQLMLQDK